MEPMMLGEPSPELVAITILNWVLGLLGLACVLSLLVFPLATIISAIVEGGKQLAPGQKRSLKKTKVFGILSALAFFGIIFIMVVWGISVYALNNVASFN